MMIVTSKYNRYKMKHVFCVVTERGMLGRSIHKNAISIDIVLAFLHRVNGSTSRFQTLLLF